MNLHSLHCHPSQKSPGGFTVSAGVARDSNRLVLEFLVTHPRGKLSIPDQGEPGPSREDELWKSTCFEFFVRQEDSDRYWELNFSPRGDWNVYSFTNYREGMQRESRVQDVHLDSIALTEDSCRCRFSLPMDTLQLVDAPLDYSLAAVIQDSEGELSYWALHHPVEKPDFHHSGGMVGKLQP